MASFSLYINYKDRALVARAAKLLRFYEDRSLGNILVQECKKIIEKYEKEQKI